MAAQRFSQRLLVSNLALLTVLFCVIGLLVGALLEGYLRKQFVSQESFRAQKMGQQFDTAMDQMNRLSLSILASSHLQSIFASLPRQTPQDYFESHLRVRTDVRETLLSFTSLQPLKGRICLVSSAQDLVDLSNGQDTLRFTKPELAALTEDRRRLLGDEARVFLGPHPEPWSRNGHQVVSLVRDFRNSDDDFGWMEINQEVDSLAWIWSNENPDKPLPIALVDEAGTTLYRNSLSAAPDDRTLAFPVALDKVPWKLVLYADKREFEGPLGTTYLILVVCGLLGFLVTSLVSWRSLRSTTAPVLSLARQVKTLRGLEGDLLDPDPRAPEEVQVLHAAFQELLIAQRREHEALLKSQHQELTARMAALQAQLNPHFVFNALMSISAYGKKSDGQSVHQLCNALASLLRYSLESAVRSATLAEELNQVRDYCVVMERRFKPYLAFSVVADAGAANVSVPRLLLQPVIENVFLHGFSDRPGPWSLEVRATATDSFWRVEVEDNGSGISLARAQEVMRDLELAVGQDNLDFFARDFSRGKLGLVSTFVRLRLLYGAAATFSIQPRHGGGCVVSLGGPHVVP